MSDEIEQLPEKRQGSKRGGARPNSGPQPYGQRYKRQIAKTADIMGKALPEAAQATVDLATGAYYLMVWNRHTQTYEKPRTKAIADAAVETGSEFIRVYQELPSMKAIEVMYERIMGKVAQPVDITVKRAVAEVISAQDTLMRIIEEHVSDEVLTLIRDDLARVAGHHNAALAAVGDE